MATYKGKSFEILEDLSPEQVEPSFKIRNSEGNYQIIPKKDVRKEHQSQLSSHVPVTTHKDVTKEDLKKDKSEKK